MEYKNCGIVSNSVMINPQISIRAKGIYCYICSFAAGNNDITLVVDEICGDMNVDRGELYELLCDLQKNDALWEFLLNRKSLMCELSEKDDD